MILIKSFLRFFILLPFFGMTVVFLSDNARAQGQSKGNGSYTADSGRIRDLPSPYILLDKPQEFKILSDNSLLMTAGKQTDLHNSASGSYSKGNAPKFLFTPHNDFDFSARIKPVFDNQYDGGAILVYTDRDNWAKILFQNTGSKLILGTSVVKNKVTDDSYFNIPNNREIYLRVKKSGIVYTFLASQDGKEWSVVRNFVYSKPKNIKIGFYSQSPMGSECKVEYADISYKGIKK
ncbi:MAG TPA: DUF1349 domain-containing protein [Sphingobacteriaceae bacterium]|nr:DUF1349 domain-containing protein [Sphingobacteriaceae bacterium]